MSNAKTEKSQAQWRLWLRTTIGSVLVDRLPMDYESAGMLALEYARVLLDELRNPTSDSRPAREVIAEAQAFRRWAVVCQEEARRIIVAENLGNVGETEPLVRFVPERRRERVELPPRGSPRSDPMWDDLLDAPWM
jgi:hypothetical protein